MPSGGAFGSESTSISCKSGFLYRVNPGRFHNQGLRIYIGLHNVIYIKFCGLQKKAKIFNFPLEKFAEMYYSIRHRKEMVEISDLCFRNSLYKIIFCNLGCR